MWVRGSRDDQLRQIQDWIEQRTDLQAGDFELISRRGDEAMLDQDYLSWRVAMRLFGADVYLPPPLRLSMQPLPSTLYREARWFALLEANKVEECILLQLPARQRASAPKAHCKSASTRQRVEGLRDPLYARCV